MRVINPNRDFTIVSNEIGRYQLSLKAIGLYVYICSKPDNWNFSVGGTASQLKDGKDSIRSAIKELEDAGFLERQQERNPDGTMGDGVWMVYNKPQEKPTSENPTPEPSRLSNTIDSKTEYISIKGEIPTPEFQEALQKKEANKVRRSLKKKYGGQIPPWVSVEKEVGRLGLGSAVSVPPSVSITPEYREYCEFVSKDRPGSHLPLVEGQKLWNNLLSEGYTPVHIRVASQIAYRVDSWWKEHFTPELFFRKVSSQGKAIDNIGKFYNYRDGTNAQIIEIKKKGEDDLKNSN